MRSKPLHTRRTGGFSLIEVIVASGLLGVVLVGTLMAFDSARNAHRATTRSLELRARGNRVATRLVEALRGADADAFASIPSVPFSVALVDFQTSSGFGGQENVWSPTRRIAFDAATGSVSWFEDPDTADERSSTWCSDVPALLDGETVNGLDDNGNGLIDEAGMCLTNRDGVIELHFTIVGDGTLAGAAPETWTLSLAGRNP